MSEILRGTADTPSVPLDRLHRWTLVDPGKHREGSDASAQLCDIFSQERSAEMCLQSVAVNNSAF